MVGEAGVAEAGAASEQPPLWCGWIRGDGLFARWLQVCTAETSAACWARLLAVEAQSQHVERTVVIEGMDPNSRVLMRR